ncbi:hypothetical protein OA492_03385, partial [Pelagibacteraceae bacterium]|nr:hypothetical protein [Pelagibacteraceae bacterium]
MKNNYYILGISCFYHDSAAVIIKGSEIISAIQEERITRKKFDNNFPINAINECLKIAKITIDEIDEISFYEDPEIKKTRIIDTMLNNKPLAVINNFKKIYNWNNNKLDLIPYIKHFFPNFNKEVTYFPHHLSHASSAFFPSPFEEAVILTIDSVGEWSTTMISIGKKNKINILKEQNFPHSVGMLYSSFTQAIGFKVDSGEYKLMGLAPYGTPKYINIIKDNIVKISKDGSIRLNLKYFDFLSGNRMINKKFLSLFNLTKIRSDKEQLTKLHMDIASSIQKVIEEIILKLSNYAYKISKCENLCLAGGVALNCVANSKILQSKIFKNIWIQPAAGDAGGALGACYLTHYIKNNNERIVNPQKDNQKNSYLGNSFSEDEINQILEKFSIKSLKLNKSNRASTIADLLEKNNILALFQGRMEFGPRALGNRSILGNPMNKEMQKIMNLKIKFRESFRPFAPIIKEDKVQEWFSDINVSQYMLFIATLNKKKKNNIVKDKLTGFEKLKVVNNIIPSVIHVDDTARIQTVTKSSNVSLYEILDKFEEKTNCPILINTSFNIRGEPIVFSIYDALKCFFNTNIDYLVI